MISLVWMLYSVDMNSTRGMMGDGIAVPSFWNRIRKRMHQRNTTKDFHPADVDTQALHEWLLSGITQ